MVRKTILIGNHLALRDFDVKTTWYILQYNNDNDDDDDNKNNNSTNNNFYSIVEQPRPKERVLHMNSET